MKGLFSYKGTVAGLDNTLEDRPDYFDYLQEKHHRQIMKSQPITVRIEMDEETKKSKYEKLPGENWVEYHNRIANVNELDNGMYRDDR